MPVIGPAAPRPRTPDAAPRVRAAAENDLSPWAGRSWTVKPRYGSGLGTGGATSAKLSFHKTIGGKLMKWFPESRFQRSAKMTVLARATVLLLLAALALQAQSGENILLVANRKDPLSRQIADYYRPLRSVPVGNVCYLDTVTAEEIDWTAYQKNIELPVANCLTRSGLREKVLYLVLTAGIPLKIAGSDGSLDRSRAGLRGFRTDPAVPEAERHEIPAQRRGEQPVFRQARRPVSPSRSTPSTWSPAWRLTIGPTSKA